ncbi:ABC transporter substrate-binding protein [Fusibacter sp. 3D3]|uniref:ABC transporter substrate-binding protein n=1 Tax=Fusibacter sp. 3D3 TaxID=1048380 RepID=UPI0008533E93|nr:extracellular solute-binding protein [Fusibacter sp. 3D3]GAU79617.1 maltose/maltodextrin ABC transporter substrate binding periplasmic protein MalE [Fusibacter sp. 3D3]
MNLSIYNLKLILSSILLAMMLTACTSPIPKSEAVKTPIYFRITWTDYSGRGNAIREIVDVFNQTHNAPYEITLVGGDEDMNAIGASLIDKNKPMIYALPYRLVKYYGENGDLFDLSADFSTESTHFYPEIWKLGVVEDNLYGIPWVGHSICLIYNKTLLKQAGVDPKKIQSLDTLLSALENIQTKTLAYGIGLVGANHNDVSWMVNQFISAYGAKLVDDAGQKVLINDPNAEEAILFYKNNLGAYAQPSWREDTGVEVMNHFRASKIAFEFQGIWGATDIDKNDNPFEIGILPLDDIGLKPEVGPILLSVSKNMPDDMKIISNQFIQFMISTEAQEMVFKGEYSPEHDAYYPFRVPMRKDIAEAMTSTEYSKYLSFLSGFDDPSIDVPVSKWQIIKEQLYQPGLHKVFNSEMTVQDFLTEVEASGNIILNE